MQQETKLCSKINLNRSAGYGDKGHECGYCNDPHGSWTCGFHSAPNLKVKDYRKLLDRGFRRCGAYNYKSNLKKSCCKLFSIRTDVTNFKMRKSHSKIWKRWQRFLRGERQITNSEQESHSNTKNENPEITENAHENEMQEELNTEQLQAKVVSALCKILESVVGTISEVKGDLKLSDLEKVETLTQKELQGMVKVKKPENVTVNFMGKLFSKLRAQSKGALDYKTLSGHEKIHQCIQDTVDKIGSIRLDTGHEYILKLNSRLQVSFNLILPESKKNLKTKTDEAEVKKERVLTMKLVKAEFTEENWNLYRNYVNQVHKKGKDENDRGSYKNWLCSKNLHFEEKVNQNGDILKMGPYHMNYYLDGVLIGVGVIDILDIGMSTVYYFFDPKFKPLKFGVVSALYEINWIREQMAKFPQFHYYYLGFYIHNCDKMNYKADFEPVELLCPTTNVYVKLDSGLKKRIQEGKITLLDKECPEDQAMLQAQYVKDQLSQLKGVNFDEDEKRRMMQFVVNGKIEVEGRVVQFTQLRKEFFLKLKGFFEVLWNEIGLETFKEIVYTL